tara:strand:- start:7402 stop:8391 length:990 start_codon:yes stop_codon:yes gene_type:complete
VSESLPELLKTIGERLRSAKRIALASHARPDGDAIGSLIGLGEALKGAGKEVVMLNQDDIPANYEFLEGVSEIRKPEEITEPLNPDVFVALDTADAKRVGERVWNIIGNPGQVIVMDHHISNERYGDLNYVDDQSPATGQTVFELIDQEGWTLSPQGRDSLWTAIVTDTGSFQYPNTTARTLEISAKLLGAGADIGWLSSQIYQNYPYRRLELLGALIDSLTRSADGRIASWKLRRDKLEELKIEGGDTEGLIEHLRAINGVVVAIAFEEVGDGTIRVSARSKSDAANVSEICQEFGGGGHKLAAGARISGQIDNVAEQFIKVAQTHLD